MNTKEAVFAAGCFWCVQAQFQRVKGVTGVVSGYTGGHTLNPTYEQVKTGTTGHYEVVKVSYDPSVVDYSVLIDIFFVIHDAGQENGQGEDIGTQYRSAVFWGNEEQRDITLAKIAKLEQSGNHIATKVLPMGAFFSAQEYHQNYWNSKGSSNPYCSIIPGKLSKMRQHFKDLTVQE